MPLYGSQRAGGVAGSCGTSGLVATGGARSAAAFSATLVLSWIWHAVEMYRERMDQATRNDIAAAAAAHRELGNAYDDAVAEGLIDRIGAEIDKRVEAKLGARKVAAQLERPSRQVGTRPCCWVPGSVPGSPGW